MGQKGKMLKLKKKKNFKKLRKRKIFGPNGKKLINKIRWMDAGE